VNLAPEYKPRRNLRYCVQFCKQAPHRQGILRGVNAPEQWRRTGWPMANRTAASVSTSVAGAVLTARIARLVPHRDAAVCSGAWWPRGAVPRGRAPGGVLLDQAPGRRGRQLIDGTADDGDLEQVEGLEQRRHRG